MSFVLDGGRGSAMLSSENGQTRLKLELRCRLGGWMIYVWGPYQARLEYSWIRS